MKVLINNAPLLVILNKINNGEYFTLEIDELLITNTSNPQYSQIVIRPSLIDITNKVLETIGDSKIETTLVETEILEFICFTQTIDEEGKQVLMNQSLTEMFLIDNSILNSTGWELRYFGEFPIEQ